ncbi:MAG: UDP-N-acetylmuramate dehydrogenase [Magnetococcales bacterium]|nr:UDP-N-acetylmuramate dehydrogenase [Magnetococcales bacterium]
MAAHTPFSHLPLTHPVQGGVPLASRTTWRIGGPARWLLAPASREELAMLLARWPDGLPRMILGGGINLLIADSGFPGAVLDLTRGMNRIYTVTESLTPAGETLLIHADAGTTTQALAHFVRRMGWSGAEFLAGIPGSVGGALRMNAGAYGGQMRDILVEADLLDPQGRAESRTPEALSMGYRHCALPAGWLFTGARFRLRRDDPEKIRERMRGFNQRRRLSQPLELPSAGSVFKNPPSGPKAWELLEQAGLRGVGRGDARISTKHCNFFVNHGQASAGEMRALIDLARATVEHHSGVVLEPEVQFAGWE